MRRLITFALVCSIMTACAEINGTKDYQIVPFDKDGTCVLFYDNPEENGGDKTEIISCDPAVLSELLISAEGGWQYKSYPCTIKKGKVKRMDYGYLFSSELEIGGGEFPHTVTYSFYSDGLAEREYRGLGQIIPEVTSYYYSVNTDGITVAQDEWKLIEYSDSRIIFDNLDESKVYNPLNLKVWTRIILKR